MNKPVTAALLAVLAFVTIVASAWAAAPRKINYQGYLTSSAGVPLSGTYSMVFALCDAATAGTCPWSETQSVAIDKGIFNVSLGAVTPLSLTFESPYYLDIQVNGEQMNARQPLTSVGYAFRADGVVAGSVTDAGVSGSAAIATSKLSGPVTDIAGNGLGALAAKSSILESDISGTIASSKISGLGPLATASAITNAEISATAGIADSKLAAITTHGKVANSATTASSTNTANAIVSRDASGNFETNVITINGTLVNATDAATKGYVDKEVTSSAISPKPPAVVVATMNTTLSGVNIIDGAFLSAGDRVLLTGQTNQVENGLWIAQAGAWTRPLDFSAGSSAGRASVLIASGDSLAGTGFLCSTPNAIVDTDPVNFVQSSAATIAANVGTGAGKVYRDKTGTTINLKSIAAGSHVGIVNNTNDITLSTDATSTNTANAIVSRDASGNFSAGNITANLTGNATTATALAANGTNCPAGSFAMGVDASGNAEGCTAAGGSADSTPPSPGGSGTITATNSGTDIALSWTAATDNVTPQSNLEYTVFYSPTNNIGTVANAEANGIVVGLPWSSNITARTVKGLTVGTTYYFNVAVKDAGLNKVMYSTVSKAPSVPTTNIILYASGTASAGNMGGRSGANALCAANKPSGYTNYAAFLSVSGTDSIAGRQSFTGLDTSRNIRSTNGTLIANNWSDLLDGTINSTLAAAGITLSTSYWWSGSNADGTVGLTCSGWTSSVNPASGSDPSGDWGVDGNTGSPWIYPGAIDRTYCADPTDVLCIAW